MARPKRKLDSKLLALGNVDAGKAFIIGHLVRSCGNLTRYELERFEYDGCSKHAWISDRLKYQRELGLECDSHFREFNTPKHSYTIVDVPGHRSFVRKAIIGATANDVALLVIDARAGEFETAVALETSKRDHSRGLTRSQAKLARMLGIQRVVVAVNKMDHESVAYSQARFESIRSRVRSILTNSGFQDTHISVVPTSALLNENILDDNREAVTNKMPWWHGPSLVRALDQVEAPPDPIKQPLRIPIDDVYRIGGVGILPTGRVASGCIRPNQTVVFAPSGTVSLVKAIEQHHDWNVYAEPGTSVGICVANRLVMQQVRRGHVCGDPADHPPVEVADFRALVSLEGRGMQVGDSLAVRCHKANVPCTCERLLYKLDRRSGNIIERAPSKIRNGEVAIVRLKPTLPMCIETFAEYPELGRLFIYEERRIVGVGIVVKTSTKERVATRGTE